MSDALARRGFLRGLAHLPLIGGGVTILGTPVRAAAPVTPNLLHTYSTWLDLERRYLMAELYPDPAKARAALGVICWDNPASMYHWHAFEEPPPLPPSTRAAVVLSAVGCGWTESFTGR